MAAMGGWLVVVLPLIAGTSHRAPLRRAPVRSLPRTCRAMASSDVLQRPNTTQGIRRRVIRKGDFVVHRLYGVGLFRGVLTGPDGRALVIRYSDTSVEVPTADQHLVSLYRRADEAELRPVRLGSTTRIVTWEKKKARTRRQLQSLLVGILEAYRDRRRMERRPCAADGAEMAEFRRTCSFDLTADQVQAVDDIARDMVLSPFPMDRLVCGDVGFGKTEVAMSAVFRAVTNGRQAAVLAPTTVLAWQHLTTMRARMPALRVELLSRLCTTKDARRVVSAVAEGDVDVLIGTHAILSKRVTFARLGLMVVDEEHRFGVNQKERMKAMAVGVDYLTLTATPIPRTLSMGLSSLRDMSVLNQPPPGRVAVITRCQTFSRVLVRRALEAELARGGQVFYVVPRIAHVEPALNLIAELLPGVDVEWAHGRVDDLETRMLRFGNGSASVLVATSVVESGLDLPRVNTIVVQNAEMFGMSSLHQLRGRVGRSTVQAYAYFLSSASRGITPEASARLKALQEFSALGDGFELSQADLALRGAGNLLGTEQSGHINDVGADLYFEMLDELIVEARATGGDEGTGT